MLVNMVFEFSHGGAIVTLLPLMLANDFALSPHEMGTLFALQAVVAVVGATPAARLIDRIGAGQILVPGLTILASAMVALPMVDDLAQTGAVMMLWSAGAVLFTSVPTVLA